MTIRRVYQRSMGDLPGSADRLFKTGVHGFLVEMIFSVVWFSLEVLCYLIIAGKRC